MVEICGRRVKISTGKKSQTVNICDAQNLDGRYEYIVRVPHPFVSESKLLSMEASSIDELVRALERDHLAQIQRMDAPGLTASLPTDTVTNHPLVELFRSKNNSFRNLAATASALSEDQILSLFERQKQSAPCRDMRRPYFMGHSGRTTSRSPTNRREEHLAIALWNDYRKSGFALPDGTTLFPVDYQLPLKSARDKANSGIGKVDLFCVDSGGEPWVAELKINSLANSRVDTPLKAILEALAYCAVLDPNMENLSRENTTQVSNLPHPMRPVRPNLLILAPAEYWDACDRVRGASPWRDPILSLSRKIEAALKIKVRWISMANCRCEMSPSGYPRLIDPPVFNGLFNVSNSESWKAE